MGRLKIWRKRGLTPQYIISTYEAAANLNDAAAALTVSEKTLRNWLDEFGYSRKRGFPKGEKKRDTSCLAEWIRNNPETPLPWSVKEIVALTGCSEGAVASYLYRKREDLDGRIRALPDLRRLNANLTAGDINVPCANLAHYTIFRREHSSRVKVIGMLANGRKFSMITTVEYLESLQRKAEQREDSLVEVPGGEPIPPPPDSSHS